MTASSASTASSPRASRVSRSARSVRSAPSAAALDSAAAQLINNIATVVTNPATTVAAPPSKSAAKVSAKATSKSSSKTTTKSAKSASKSTAKNTAQAARSSLRGADALSSLEDFDETAEESNDNREPTNEMSYWRAVKEQRILDMLAAVVDYSDQAARLDFAANVVFNCDAQSVEILVRMLEEDNLEYRFEVAQVLTEVGLRDASLLQSHAQDLLRMGMTRDRSLAPHALCALAPTARHLDSEHWESLWSLREMCWNILTDGGNTFAWLRPASVRLLSAMCLHSAEYARSLAGGLVDLLGKCPAAEVATYAESILPALGNAHSHRAKPVLDRRMKDMSPAEIARLRRAMRGPSIC